VNGRGGRFLDHLPGVYRQDDFLGKFLAPFEEVFEGFEGLLDEIDRYFAPAFTDPELLPWLATWLSLALDPGWDEAKRRRLIAEAVELYRWRGTVRGLKRYLEIYTGLEPEIREWRWPGGMQIGIASRIGGLVSGNPVPSKIERFERHTPLVEHDYYVVDTTAPSGHPVLAAGERLRLHYRADAVQSADWNADGSVTVWPRGAPAPDVHPAATITRRDALLDDRYTLEGPGGAEEDYLGDTFLVDEEERPYRFVVDVRVPAEESGRVDLDKVRSIVDLEKPAHTLYSLKLTPVEAAPLEPMQIGIHSTVEVDTTIG
jgi:phage tail-like protein